MKKKKAKKQKREKKIKTKYKKQILCKQKVRVQKINKCCEDKK